MKPWFVTVSGWRTGRDTPDTAEFVVIAITAAEAESGVIGHYDFSALHEATMSTRPTGGSDYGPWQVGGTVTALHKE